MRDVKQLKSKIQVPRRQYDLGSKVWRGKRVQVLIKCFFVEVIIILLRDFFGVAKLHETVEYCIIKDTALKMINKK